MDDERHPAFRRAAAAPRPRATPALVMAAAAGAATPGWERAKNEALVQLEARAAELGQALEHAEARARAAEARADELEANALELDARERQRMGLTAAHNASGATDVDPTGAVARIQAEIATVAARGELGADVAVAVGDSDSRSDSERDVGAVDAAEGRPEALTAASPRAQVLRRTFARFERACAASRRARLYTEVRAPFLPHGRAG